MRFFDEVLERTLPLVEALIYAFSILVALSPLLLLLWLLLFIFRDDL